jgi:hypothetical protein
VDQRIKMAARYAAIEGGLSAGAYPGSTVDLDGEADYRVSGREVTSSG